jgi:hypothetical protein
MLHAVAAGSVSLFRLFRSHEKAEPRNSGAIQHRATCRRGVCNAVTLVTLDIKGLEKLFSILYGFCEQRYMRYMRYRPSNPRFAHPPRQQHGRRHCWSLHAALLPCCPAALLPCCPAALLPCCPAALLPCCLAASHSNTHPKRQPKGPYKRPLRAGTRTLDSRPNSEIPISTTPFEYLR